MSDRLEDYRKANPRQKDLFHFVPDVKINEPALSKPDKNTAWKIQQVTRSLNSLLQYKNLNYGNVALEPLGVFNKNEVNDSILIALDNKLARIKNSKELRKNDICDFINYGILLCVQKDWLSFEEFKD